MQNEEILTRGQQLIDDLNDMRKMLIKLDVTFLEQLALLKLANSKHADDVFDLETMKKGMDNSKVMRDQMSELVRLFSGGEL